MEVATNRASDVLVYCLENVVDYLRAHVLNEAADLVERSDSEVRETLVSDAGPGHVALIELPTVFVDARQGRVSTQDSLATAHGVDETSSLLHDRFRRLSCSFRCVPSVVHVGL